jgi:hypothetical protein
VTALVVLMMVTNLVLLIGYVYSTNIVRHDDPPRDSVLPPGERRDDPNTLLFRVSLRLRKVNPILIAFTVALTVCCVPIIAIFQQQHEIQDQRAESLGLLCDINGILITFIEAPPDLPRDAVALKKLRKERCEDLIADIKRSQ